MTALKSPSTPASRAEEEHNGQMAFVAECAKLGITEADKVRAGGTMPEMHESRKTLRRAINKIREEIGMADPTDSQAAAIVWAGVQISKIEGMMEGYTGHPGQAQQSNDWSFKNGQRLRVMRNASDFKDHYLKQAQGAGESDSSIGLDDFFRGVANLPSSPAVRNALSVGTDTAGGFTVPSLVMPEILAALVPASSLLQAGAGIVDLSGVDAKSVTTAAVNAIPTAAWRSEGGNVAESDPTFRGVVATPHSLAFYFKVSRELLADSPNLRPALIDAITKAFAKELDRAGLRGSGTAPEPRGILNTSGIQSVGNGTNGASQGTTRWANLTAAVQAVLAADAPMPTAAIMSPRSLVGFSNLADTTNQPLQRPSVLQDMQFLATSQIPNNLTVGTSTDCTEIYVGDFRSITFMMRERMSVQLLSEAFATTGQVGFLCHVRADVVVQYPAAMAVVTGMRA